MPGMAPMHNQLLPSVPWESRLRLAPPPGPLQCMPTGGNTQAKCRLTSKNPKCMECNPGEHASLWLPLPISCCRCRTHESGLRGPPQVGWAHVPLVCCPAPVMPPSPLDVPPRRGLASRLSAMQTAPASAAARGSFSQGLPST